VSDNHASILTFQQIREQCEQGNAEAWRAFVSLYGPLFAHLLEVYSPSGTEASQDPARKMLARLAENDFARLRETPRQSEREFLTDIRALLLDTALVSLDEIPQAETNFTLENLGKLMEGLPLAHQEMVVFRLSGYTDASLENMLRIAPRVAEAAFARLEADFAAAGHLELDRCPWPVPWLSVLRQARTTKKDNCPELHQFLRIQDGQVSWYDKEPVEKHVGSCLYCLERWTALRELGYWRRKAKPVTASQVEELLQAVPLTIPEKKSFLRRMFGGAT
jgi:hypothetical protein